MCREYDIDSLDDNRKILTARRSCTDQPYGPTPAATLSSEKHDGSEPLISPLRRFYASYEKDTVASIRSLTTSAD